MAKILELRCTVCSCSFTSQEVMYTCPSCGEVGTLDMFYDYSALKSTVTRDDLANRQEFSMWRYRDLLPIYQASTVSPLQVGFTPLYNTPRLAEKLQVEQVWVKDDGKNPTASLKDRASAMVVAHAQEEGIQVVTTASTGNAAAALAGIGASVGIQTIIFVPAAAPQAKIAQLLIYGAAVLLVEASYDVAFDLCLTVSEEQGWYCRNTGINPYTTEGKKTVAFEIAEQLGWDVPDAVIVSVGDGSIIGGIYKGFYDLLHLGWIQRIPRLIGVQSVHSNPFVHAWTQGIPATDMRPVEAHSIADSIVAGFPRDRVKALRAVQETQGAFVAVEDNAILQAIPEFAQLTGVFAEPASAAAWAGAQRAAELGFIHKQDRVVILSTGSGLKDINRAQQAVHAGLRVKPEIEAVRKALKLE